MLTLIHKPYSYGFSRNPNYVEILTDNYRYQANLGQKAHLAISAMENAVVNNTLTIAYGAWPAPPTTVVFTFKSATNISLNEVAIKGSGQSAEEYATQLANDIMSHAGISPYFILWGYYGQLFIQAISGGTAYNLGATTSTVSGFGFQFQDGTNDVQTVLRDNYNIRLLLQQNINDNWVDVIDIKKPPGIDNKVRMDLRRFIDDCLEYQIPNFKNTSTLNVAFKCTKSIRNFRCILEEHYGTPPTAKTTTVSPGDSYDWNDGTIYQLLETRILKAGFDSLSARGYSTNQLNYYYNNNSFLTRQPRTKYIRRNQREFLYFISRYQEVTGVIVKFKLYDIYGNETVSYGLTNPGVYVESELGPSYEGSYNYNLNIGEVICFPINYESSPFWNSSNYIKMVVSIVKQSDANINRSEEFTYYLDEEVYKDETTIYFINSDTGLDTIRCFGEQELGSNYERTQVTALNNYNGNTFTVQDKTVFTEKTNTAKIFSGWKTKKELLYADEMLMSHYAFIYNNEFGQNIETPIIFTTKTLVKHETNKNLYGYLIEYYEAIKSEISQARYHTIPII